MTHQAKLLELAADRIQANRPDDLYFGVGPMHHTNDQPDPYEDWWPQTVEQPHPNSSQGPIAYGKENDSIVPASLNEHPIFQDPMGPKLWAKLKKRAKISDGPWEILGSGTRGTAFGAGSLVLKITNDRTEAVGAALIRNTPDPLGNAQRIYSVWQLKGESLEAFAIVQERLDLAPKKDPWNRFADFWPDWSRENNYAPIIPENTKTFLEDCESSRLVSSDDENWIAFKKWFEDLASYLASIKLLYHDFWHRNMLVRKRENKSDQHVAIDFGYSESLAKVPNIDVIARFRRCIAARS